jgi:FKBP-type peptidyl-prolyl cis-trans isomerase FkpA
MSHSCNFSRNLRFAISLVLGAAIAVCSAQASKTATAASEKSALPPTALMIVDQKLGEGPAVEDKQPVLVHYTGYLWDATAPGNRGKQFDSSTKQPVPFGFIVGAGRVIKGWDEGVLGMKVGGQRTVIVPPDKAYKERGAGAVIPPNATLVFDIELMGIIGKTAQPRAEPSDFVLPKNAAQK